MSTDLARETGGPLGQIGQAYYFHPDTLARGKELGLDGFRWYMLGRGGVLGDVETMPRLDGRQMTMVIAPRKRKEREEKAETPEDDAPVASEAAVDEKAETPDDDTPVATEAAVEEDAGGAAEEHGSDAEAEDA